MHTGCRKIAIGKGGLISGHIITNVRPNPGFGIANRNQGQIFVSVLESNVFFQNENFSFMPKY